MASNWGVTTRLGVFPPQLVANLLGWGSDTPDHSRQDAARSKYQRRRAVAL